jgi:hypothetical protein
MASQVLQTATLELEDENGDTRFSMDFSPKATHFPTTSNSWSGGGADPIGDLISLSRVIRTDGQVGPDRLIFGATAFENFLDDSKVQERLDNRRINIGQVLPVVRGEGAVFQGSVHLGQYRYEMWTYDGQFKDISSGTPTDFVAPDKVIMMSSTGTRLDLTFGAIPKFIPDDARAATFLPSRIRNAAGGGDLTTSSWVTPDGEQLFVQAGTRPLTIPTAIDTYGCLDTEI